MFSRDMVCLRNISVDTLHKGDNDDDDDDDDDDDNNNNNNNNIIITQSYTSYPFVYNKPLFINSMHIYWCFMSSKACVEPKWRQISLI